MADALCGPSNALQSFQKHSSVDRTLQQDRLTSRHSHTQGFRSGQGQNAGVLDHEFEAFQAGLYPSQLNPELLQQSHHAFPQPYAHPYEQPVESLGWASDFQNLQLSPQIPQPLPTLHHQHNQAQPRSSWHADFNQAQRAPIQPNLLGQNRFQPSFRNAGFEQNSSQQDKGKEKVMPDQVHDTAAFEREFEAYASETLQKDVLTAATRETMVSGNETLIVNSSMDMSHIQDHPVAQSHNNPRIHQQERLQREADKVADQTPRNDDDLAHTAGELLERVSDNSTQKFQESNFLALMRRLRDREVRVEGDQMVDVEHSVGLP